MNLSAINKFPKSEHKWGDIILNNMDKKEKSICYYYTSLIGSTLINLIG